MHFVILYTIIVTHYKICLFKIGASNCGGRPEPSPYRNMLLCVERLDWLLETNDFDGIVDYTQTILLVTCI